MKINDDDDDLVEIWNGLIENCRNYSYNAPVTPCIMYTPLIAARFVLIIILLLSRRSRQQPNIAGLSRDMARQTLYDTTSY